MIGSVLAKLDPQRSVRARLSALMGVSGFVFCVLLVLLMGYRAEQRERRSVERALHTSALTIAHLLDQDIRSRRDELALLALAIGNEHPGETDKLRALVNKVQASAPAYAWIGLADQNGKVLIASDGLLEGESVSQRPWFQMGQRGVFFGDPRGV